MQIQQDQVIARAQLGSDTSEYVISIYQELAQPEMAAVWEKVLLQPDDLSTQEMIRVNALLTTVAELIFRDCYLLDRGIFTECETLIDIHGRRFFGNRYAQSWWKYDRPPGYFGLSRNVDDQIASFGKESNLQLIQKIKAEL